MTSQRQTCTAVTRLENVITKEHYGLNSDVYVAFQQAALERLLNINHSY